MYGIKIKLNVTFKYRAIKLKTHTYVYGTTLTSDKDIKFRFVENVVLISFTQKSVSKIQNT